MKITKKKLSPAEEEKLLATLKDRFEKHMHRHKGLPWTKVEKKLRAHPEKLATIHMMEKTGGGPDVAILGKKGQYAFCDFSAESPSGRRSLCFDKAAWKSRKEAKPSGNALDIAAAIGIELLSEEEYRSLQELEAFDMKTSSWVQTPANIRKLGGALFCDRRYDTVFVYHNGAESYYAARGFRGSVKL